MLWALSCSKCYWVLTAAVGDHDSDLENLPASISLRNVPDINLGIYNRGTYVLLNIELTITTVLIRNFAFQLENLGADVVVQDELKDKIAPYILSLVLI